MQKRKKLNLSVKREFQRWLFIRIFGVVLLSALVAAAILYIFARQEIGESFYEAHIRLRRVSDLLWPVIIAGSGVSLLSGMLLALFLPQKIAGPIYRIEEDLEAVKRGDLTVHITLREHDILKDLAGTLNQTIASLRGKVAQVKLGFANLEQEVAQHGGEVNLAVRQAKEELSSLKT